MTIVSSRNSVGIGSNIGVTSQQTNSLPAQQHNQMQQQTISLPFQQHGQQIQTISLPAQQHGQMQPQLQTINVQVESGQSQQNYAPDHFLFNSDAFEDEGEVQNPNESLLDLNSLFNLDKRLDNIDANIRKLCESNVYLKLGMETIMKHMKVPVNSENQVVNTESNQSPEEETKHTSINTIAELNQFEESVKDETFRRKLLGKFCREMGKDTAKGLGRNVALTLIDEIFTRELFLLCSWTGQTADTAFPEGKVAFQKYPETVKFFWEIVNNADKSYDVIANRLFLQDIMSQAKQRAIKKELCKRIRSTNKCRPSKLKYKKRKIEPVPNEHETDSNSNNFGDLNDDPEKSEDETQKLNHDDKLNSVEVSTGGVNDNTRENSGVHEMETQETEVPENQAAEKV